MTKCHFNLDRTLIPFVAVATYLSSNRRQYYGEIYELRLFAMPS